MPEHGLRVPYADDSALQAADQQSVRDAGVEGRRPLEAVEAAAGEMVYTCVYGRTAAATRWTQRGPWLGPWRPHQSGTRQLRRACCQGGVSLVCWYHMLTIPE